jgi:prealbumin domain-containing protein
MRITRFICAIALPTMMLAVGACDNDKAIAPDNNVVSTVTGTTGAVFSEPSDTTPVGSTPATIHGSVILITVTPSNGQPVDTSHTSPIAGARLSLSQRVNNGGTITLVPYAQATSDANGAFSFAEVPAGYYVLKAEGPSGAPYQGAQAYIATSVADIAVEFRLVTGL